MNRDAIIATLIGFAIGLVITGMILLGPTITRQLPGIRFPQIQWPTITLPSFPGFGSKSAPSPAPTNAPPALTIDAPLPDTIEPKDTLIVSGTAPAGSVVVVGGPVDEAATHATAEGKYAAQVSILEGKNDISVTMISATQQVTQSVTVYYTPEEF